MEKHEIYLGTFYNKDTILRLTSVAKTLSWVVVGVFTFELLIRSIAILLQIARGFWTGMMFTDVIISIFNLFEQPLRGVVYFIVLQGVSQALMIFMDMEDNTRRAARDIEQK